MLLGVVTGLAAHLVHGLVDPGFRAMTNLSTLVYLLLGVIGAIALQVGKGRESSSALTDDPAGSAAERRPAAQSGTAVAVFGSQNERAFRNFLGRTSSRDAAGRPAQDRPRSLTRWGDHAPE